MDLHVRFDRSSAIPVPSETRTPAEAGAWAAEVAAAHVAREGGDDAAASRIAAALIDVANVASDDARHLVLVGIDARVIAPLALFAVGPISDAEQAAFLRPNTTEMPVTTETVESATFGVGVSATTIERHSGLLLGFERWLFPGKDGAVAAVLGPVPAGGLAFVEEAAKFILHNSRLEGFEPLDDRDRVDELDGATARFGEAWSL
jgi:hypothetical protein